MKYFLFILFLSIQVCLSQDTVSRTLVDSKITIPLEAYRELKADSNFKADSVGFIVNGKDTLVQLEKVPFGKRKTVTVPYEVKDSLFLITYKNVVFNKDKYLSQENPNRMRYWKEPLRIYFNEIVDFVDRNALKDFAIRLEDKVDSLKIEFVKSIGESNFIIYYKDADNNNEYSPDMSTKNEGFYTYWNRNNQLTNTFLKIDKDKVNPSTRVELLKWRFFQSLGYFRLQSNFPCTSYFSKCFEEVKILSDSDIELLRYHYSYGICKGSNLLDFETQHELAKDVISKNPNNKMSFIHEIE
ncbi:hypothetical protein LCGC14_0199130 [marine sediment metagenome]|uniref:Uncharacterized protein n=1 Tax=marine sediment metagenome TaxID=412755 RepID=A0A0F9XMD6_9ZZZZ|nr:hypothetical protein [Maribacter sp.]HDZ03913.1 hypothetical protein [Maribacter sp.]